MALSGQMSGNDREEVFRQFRTLEKRILVCTNVGARGLDIKGCTTVVNYDVPMEVWDFYFYFYFYSFIFYFICFIF